MSARPGAGAFAAERLIGRTLIVVTYVSVGLLLIGVALMVAHGISPLSDGPSLDLAALGAQLWSLEPVGFLWLGLLVVVAAPIGRVVMAAVAYARDADWLMFWVSLGIVAIIAIGVLSAFAATV